LAGDVEHLVAEGRWFGVGNGAGEASACDQVSRSAAGIVDAQSIKAADTRRQGLAWLRRGQEGQRSATLSPSTAKK
jgi:hypothetical protein